MSGYQNSSEAQVNAITANMQNQQPLSAQGIIGLAQGLNQNQNSILQNVGLSRDLRAKQAIGQALSQNTGVDGSVDIKNVIAQSKNNPDLAYGLSSLIPESQQSNVTSQNFHQLVYGNALSRAESIASAMQQIEEDPDPTSDSVQAAIGSVLSQHPDDGIMLGDGLRLLSDMPKGVSGDALKLYLRPFATQTMGALQQLTTQLGSNQFVNTGANETQVAATGGDTGQLAPTGASLALSMSPGQAGSTTTIVSPGPDKVPGAPPAGQPWTISQAQATQLTGQGGVLSPSQITPGAGGPVAGPQGPMTQQDQSDAASLLGPIAGSSSSPAGFNPNNPASVQAAVNATPPQAAAAAKGFGFQSAPAPNQAATIAANAGALSDQMKTLDASIPAQEKVMDTLQYVMDLLPKVKTGGGASTRAEIASDVQKITGGAAPQKLVDVLAGGDQAATQELVKLLNASVVNQFQAAGLGHNDEFSTLQGANPDIDKVAGVFQGLYNVSANNLAFDQAQQEFYQKNSSSSGNIPQMFSDYAKKVGLTPDNASSWKDANDPAGQLGGGTRLLQAAEQGNKGAVAALAQLKAHPGVPIPRVDGRGAYVYDAETGQINVVPPGGVEKAQ